MIRAKSCVEIRQMPPAPNGRPPKDPHNGMVHGCIRGSRMHGFPVFQVNGGGLRGYVDTAFSSGYMIMPH